MVQMKAAVLYEAGGPEVLKIEEVGSHSHMWRHQHSSL